VREFCLRILEAGDLESKLAAPVGSDGNPLPDPTGAARTIDRPTRDAALRMAGGAPPLPRPGQLAEADARALCLARFAHHELMAVEFFAWALLRWPDVPAGLRHGWLGALEEEQLHCRLYLDRLAAHDSQLADHALSDYFWRHAPAIAASDHGPSAFLAAMGLTLEQANLDFAVIYRDAFRSAGDEASALVCQRIRDDEIGHVKLAADWIQRLDPAGREDTLSDAFIAYVETARSSQQMAGQAKVRPPA